MDEHSIRKLLKKYAEGLCTESEKRLVEQWYLDVASSKACVHEVPGEERLMQLKEESWKNIQPQKKGRMRLLKWVGSAAAAVVVLTGATWLIQYRKLSTGGAAAYVQLETREGEVRSFLLPDSSTVWLNSGSTIHYSQHFNEQKREVILDEGEAFFDVRHIDGKTFTVAAGNTKTTVLGTAFNIRSYHYLSERQISVARGKVQVETLAGGKEQTAATLLPGEQLVVDTASRRYKMQHVKAEDFIAWKDGLLQFNKESLFTISKMIESKFHMRSRFESDSIGSLLFKASFKTSDPLKTILDDLSEAGNLEYKIEADEIIFSLKK